MNPYIIWIGIADEAYCFDISAPFQQRFADTVHTIHYATVAGENNREGQIAIENQARVANNLAAGQLFNLLVRPKGFIELTDGRQLDALVNQVT